MKKKFRDIEVNGQAYAWAAQWKDNSFKIWKDKVVVHTGTFKDTIAPANIRAIIEKEKL
jgi:hypothetical protein